MNYTFNDELELYAKIEELENEINPFKIEADYRLSCASGWYTNQKDFYGKIIQHNFTRSSLIMFINKNELVSHKLMATTRCEKGHFTYSLFVNKID